MILAGFIALVIVAEIGISKSGITALLGVLLGVGLAVFTIWSISALTRSFLRFQPEPKDGVRSTVLIGVLKLPITLAFIFFGTRLPGAGLVCFLASIGLVYSVFVALWSLSNT